MSTEATLVLNSNGTMEYRGWNVVKVTKDRWDADRGSEAITKRSKKALLAEIDTRLSRETALDEVVEDDSPVGEALNENAGETRRTTKRSRKQERSGDLVGNKITRSMVREIRAGWLALDGGKMNYYRAQAARYGLGLETVAKISRGDIYGNEELGLTDEELTLEE